MLPDGSHSQGKHSFCQITRHARIAGKRPIPFAWPRTFVTATLDANDPVGLMLHAESRKKLEVRVSMAASDGHLKRQQFVFVNELLFQSQTFI